MELEYGLVENALDSLREAMNGVSRAMKKIMLININLVFFCLLIVLNYYLKNT